MRLAAAALALFVLVVGACVPGSVAPPARDLTACLAPSSDPNAVSLPALVDRADIIVHATVVRVEVPPTPSGAVRDLVFGGGTAGQRVTLRAIETAKGSVASEFAVYDSPCPLLGAQPGESLVVLLDGATYPDGTLRPIGLPVSALRATPDRSLAQVMSAMRAIRALDGDARALFEGHSWKVNDGKYAVDEFTLPAAADFVLAGRQFRTIVQLAAPFEQYATLSATVGLDLRPHAGEPAELLTFLLEHKRGMRDEGAVFGHVLIADRRIVGAWVSVVPEAIAFSLHDRGAVLALLARPPGGFAWPTNRVPQGVNLARAYDLTSARGIAYKSSARQGGEITDPAKIRAFAEALDETLTTVQATLIPIAIDNATPRPATTYWFSIDFTTRYLSLQYDTSDGMLMVYADGFSAKAPARFAALVAELRF
jgi:hypothetical protein